MKMYQVDLNISADKILAYYEGRANQVVARDRQGVSIQFPADVLRPFVTNSGVQGTFNIIVDKNNKFVEIKRIE